MIKVSVLYPNTDDCRFDMDYYRGTHIPLVEEKLGAACKRMEVERGVAGAAPDSAPAYVAGVNMYFDSLEAYSEALSPHAEAIMGDIPNYTNVEPVVQVSELE